MSNQPSFRYVQYRAEAPVDAGKLVEGDIVVARDSDEMFRVSSIDPFTLASIHPNPNTISIDGA